MNKKALEAGDVATTAWFFFLLTILTLGIIGGAAVHYGSERDYRQVDAELLHQKILNCLKTKKIDLKNTEEFLSACEINTAATEKKFLIAIYEKNELHPILKLGPGDITQCALSDKNKNFPRCKNTTLNLNEKEIIIYAGSNNNREVIIA